MMPLTMEQTQGFSFFHLSKTQPFFKNIKNAKIKSHLGQGYCFFTTKFSSNISCVISTVCSLIYHLSLKISFLIVVHLHFFNISPTPSVVQPFFLKKSNYSHLLNSVLFPSVDKVCSLRRVIRLKYI